MNETEKERLIKKDIVSIENRVRHAFNQGYEMGLKENKEQSGDAISRQAVDDAIYDYSRSCDVNYQQIMEFIEKIPPVTPQQRTGRWIDSHIPESTLCECSECGFACGAYSFNYCPHCGAKMEVE